MIFEIWVNVLRIAMVSIVEYLQQSGERFSLVADEIGHLELSFHDTRLADASRLCLSFYRFSYLAVCMIMRRLEGPLFRAWGRIR
jgi:hypothetical protein